MTLTLHQLFPTVVATTKLAIDPLDLAGHLQTLLALRGESVGNPNEGCAWTGDINGVWQLHRHVEFAPLVHQVSAQAEHYLEAVGFDRSQVALHLQRCWPVLSDWDQLVGRHHHPNDAHHASEQQHGGDGRGHGLLFTLKVQRLTSMRATSSSKCRGAPAVWTVNPSVPEARCHGLMPTCWSSVPAARLSV